jgi:hypothetical protein
MNAQETVDFLRGIKPSDANMPFPSSTPDALTQHNQPKSLQEFPKRIDPEPAADATSENPPDAGSTVDLTLCDGTIVRVSGYILSAP